MKAPDQKEITIAPDCFHISTLGEEEANSAAASRWLAVCKEMGWNPNMDGLDILANAQEDARMVDLLNLGLKSE